ncbi:NAD(P)-dependent oxidoreductase [Leptolyngbya sp. 'hensonii']|uniref:SDR family oxidoreductase n=1 Tax=Leptolyngbya sp. 'hensonii' TaxID=1922337 RepID=UPI00094F4FC8|nr:NAD(P)-dependent oxidoreductase [Leptolyngbya sp. 'hensonii']OLP17794.1 NAD(P)-dependent oxidoreductase [Leptolyngbya sp. 'hensonii']
MSRRRLLITGASGFLGWHLCQVAQDGWEVYGTSFSRPLTIPGVKRLQVDLRDWQQLRQLFADVQPAAVVHAAAQSNPNLCQAEPEAAAQINVAVSWAIADLCAESQILCAFTSTDLVFDGQHPPYRETDPVCPLSHYGEQKVQAEEGIRQRYPQSAICRMPLMFGSANQAKSFIQPFIQTLRAGGNLRLFTDEYRTPASGTTAARGILLALEKVQGRIHLGGRERISRYAFGQLMAEVLDLPADQLQGCLQAEVPMAAPRPRDVSLDSSLAFALGYHPLSLRDELTALRGKV